MHETTTRDASVPLRDASTAELVKALSHPNGWWRDTAQRLLVERRDTAAVPALVALASTADKWRTRLHALWTLDGLDAIEPALVTAALADKLPEVRNSAIRLAERWLGEAGTPDRRGGRQDGSTTTIRGFARSSAASLGALPAGPREDLLERLLRRAGDDPVTVDAALSSLRGSELAMVDRLRTSAAGDAAGRVGADDAGGDDRSQRRGRGRAEGAGRDRRRRRQPSGSEVRCCADSKSRCSARRLPGNAAGRRNAVRADGGSRPAPVSDLSRRPRRAGRRLRVSRGRPTGRRRPARPGADLRLNGEPRTFAAFAAGKDPQAQRAAALLARIVWPGKPGAAVAAPLTPVEQARFAAGRELYRNICQGCHQPDGRGQDRIAPTLVGSALALAPPDIPARVLLHGKEGPIGLMPPVGTTLQDEQIAAVLTYVRREWGQSASPVDAETVKRVREASAGRTRPWRHEELIKMLPAPK